MIIRFFVAGLPRAMSVGSFFRFKKDGVEKHIQGRRNTDWAVLVGQVGRAHAPEQPLTGPVCFTALFHLPRPQALMRRAGVLPIKRPDIDNLVHKLTDFFTGVFWADDAQIVDFVARKRYAAPGAPTGVEIIVAPLTPAAVAAPQPELMEVSR